MPLPILTPGTYESTGVTLPLEDYFNPIRNTSYGNPVGAAVGNRIAIKSIIAIEKAMAAAGAIPELYDFGNYHYAGGRQEAAERAALDYVLSILPPELHWTVFHTCTVRDGQTEGCYKIKWHSFYPSEVRRGESYRETNYTFIKVFPPNSDGEFTVDPGANANIPARILQMAQNTSDKMLQYAEEEIIFGEAMTPRVIALIYKYVNNIMIYSPIGEQHMHTIPWDKWRPSSMYEHLTAGHLLTFSVSADGSIVKYDCRPQPGSRQHYERVFSYSTDVMGLLPITIRGPKEPAATLYGVELEACSDYSPKQVIQAQKELFFLLKQDGSISGDRSQKYEMVTVPTSLKAHKRLWAEFFNNLDYRQFDTSKNTGNGMHVHIDRKTFEKPEHLNRLTWFIINPVNEDFIYLISERPSKTNLNQWAARPDVVGHGLKKYQAAKAATRMNSGLRGAVHYKGSKTVEIRLFKGIVSYATVVKNLEFVDSVVEFTRFCTLSQTTVPHYLAWLKATPKNKYEMIKTFLEEAKVETLIPVIALEDYLFECKHEEDIEDKLNKAPFKVTNALLTILNKKRKKRIFKLNKDGKVECTTRRGGLLAKLDLPVQQKQIRGSATFAITNI